MSKIPHQEAPAFGTPPTSPRRAFSFLSPNAQPHVLDGVSKAQSIRMPVLDPETHDLSLRPCHRTPACVRGMFVVGNPYEESVVGDLGSLEEAVMHPEHYGRACVEFRFTVKESADHAALRLGFSSGTELPHSRFVLPGDEVAHYSQRKHSGVSIRLPELASVQSAGEVGMAWDEEKGRLGGVLGVSLQTGHYLTPDVDPSHLSESRYLARFVKAWAACADMRQLVGATVYAVRVGALDPKVPVGVLDGALIAQLLRVEDPSFAITAAGEQAKKQGVVSSLTSADLTAQAEARPQPAHAQGGKAPRRDFIIRARYQRYAPFGPRPVGRHRRGLFGGPSGGPRFSTEGVGAPVRVGTPRKP